MAPPSDNSYIYFQRKCPRSYFVLHEPHLLLINSWNRILSKLFFNHNYPYKLPKASYTPADLMALPISASDAVRQKPTMPANEQHVVKSSDPETSQACIIALAAIELTAVIAAHHFREQLFSEYGGFFWAKMIGLLTSLVLVNNHQHLRAVSYNKEHYGTFYRALPFFYGVVAVCAMAIFSTVFWTQFPPYLFAYQAEMWFWIDYWVEWWTAILGDVLAGCGC